jgi:HAE1 family hydrophobic/amphiphilic exporter-1
MSSISGRFLYQFGITAAVAILVSLVVSFTLTPMMSARLLRAEPHGAGHGEAASRSGFYGRIDRLYTRMLVFSMRRRAAVVVVALLVILSAVPLYGAVRQEYVPTNVDEGEFNVGITAPEGTSVAAMNEAVLAVEKELREIPAIRTMLASAGGGFLGGVNQGRIYVRIAPHEERTLSFTKLWNSTLAGNPLDAFRNNYSQRDVMTEVRKRTRKFTHLRVSARNASSFNFGGGPWDIDFVLRGPDIDQLAAYADDLRKKVTDPPGGGEAEVPGIVDADTTLKLDKPELRVVIDRDLAADVGVQTADIATALRLMVGGDDQVTRYRDESVNDDYDVQLRLESGGRNDPAAIGRLTVPSSLGGLVRVDSLVRFERATAPSRIDRLDRQRQVSLRGSVGPGFALADRLDALREAALDLNMPDTYTVSVSGKGRELERTFTEFLFAFMLSIAFMYMILASQFESLIHPVTILLSLPLAIPFAMLGQFITGDTLNLYSALGILVLFGVVKKNSILQIDHMNGLRAKGIDRASAIIQANRDRLRPILMTTLTLVAGMLPLALGTGPGAEERRSVAIVVIAGQSLSLLLTLLVTPVAYSIFDDIGSLAWVRALGSRIAGFGRARRAQPAAPIETEGGD